MISFLYKNIETMLNKAISHIVPLMPESFVWQFSKRYVAGKTIDDALRISRQLNSENIFVTIDLLGEFITSIEQAKKNTNDYIALIKRFAKSDIKGSFSVKPSFFGLLIDEEVCYRNILDVVTTAAKFDRFVRLDMEDSECTSKELKLYKRLRADFPFNVGIVIQAYLRRSEKDIETLIASHSPKSPVNIRLCKGIYIEPELLAFKEFEEIRQNYLKLLEKIFAAGIYVGVATHDKFLVNGACDLIQKYSLSFERYEFQMLYGVAPNLRDDIVRDGHKMRIYVPYGEEWFGYCTRRLKENPKMVGDIIKALFVRN